MIWGPWRTDYGMKLGDYIQVEGRYYATKGRMRKEGIVYSVSYTGFELNTTIGDPDRMYLERWRLGKLPEVKAMQHRTLSEPVS